MKHTFSLRNGLKLTWAHLHDEQMFIAWFTVIALPSLASLARELWWFAISWFVIGNMVYVLIRCWDDPVELGWCDK